MITKTMQRPYRPVKHDLGPLPKRSANGRIINVAMAIAFAATFLIASSAGAVDTLPILWEAGGLSAGGDGAGQAARVATDTEGNVAVVSGPFALTVTSYTADGVFRWQGSVSPSVGTFIGDWVAAAPNGDFIAIGHNQSTQGNPIAITMVRYSSGGSLLWRVDFSTGIFPSVARLLVDDSGNAYVTGSAVAGGLFVRKYDPAGVLIWDQRNLKFGGFAAATSLALSSDGADVVATGRVSGGAIWITSVYDAVTGSQRWSVTAAEGVFTRDVVVDDTNVYVTGQGNVGINAFLTVIAYDRATGARLWRTDRKPSDGTGAAGLWMAMAPDGSLVATGQATRGFLDWYTVAFETNGTVRWEAVRDGGLNTDEVPAAVLVLPNGSTVVTGRGGPNLPGNFIPGVTAGYSPTGMLLWEAFSPFATVWVAALPNGDIVAAGGFDAYLAAFRPTGTIGDVNQDGTINLLDVQPFVNLLTNGMFQAEADINQDGVVSLLDVAPFVELLSG